MSPASALGRHSVRRRLAALIFALLGLLGAGFAWMAYAEFEEALRVSGTERLAGAARQVAELLDQSARARVAETRRLAADAEVREAVLGEAGLETPVPEAVRRFVSQNPLTTVWVHESDGRLRGRLAAGAKASATAAPPISASGSSPLQSDAGHVSYYTTVLVQPTGGTAPSRLLSIQRPLRSSQAAAMIQRLIGSEVVLKLGNASGDVWTDLSAPTSGPDVTVPGAATTYTAEGGETWTGIAQPVPEAPWLVWVAVPEHTILAPARTLLQQMVPVTLVMMALGALGVYVVSGRITRPLEKVVQAAESIAAGDYTRRVSVERSDEIGRLATAFNVMAAHVQAAHQSLERRVAERTSELENANRELEAFSYSVSHDLRAPLRHIVGFAALLEKHVSGQLDEQGRRYLDTIAGAARQMGRLVDDLLGFSRMARADMLRSGVDLGQLADEVIEEVKQPSPGRCVVWRVGELPIVTGDRAMLRLALSNLVENAFKYTSKRDVAEIEIGTVPSERGEHVVYVKDNGAGFDMAYAGKLFGVFQRLHSPDEFEGTGIGLANVRRIVQRHGGRTWAEGAVDAGATFYLALPSTDERTTEG